MIKINVVNTGSAGSEYPKLQTVLKSGSGAPDVVQIGYDSMSSFILSKSLAPLDAYGADQLQSEFFPQAWSAVTAAGHVYGIPQDYGPWVMFYRSDVFTKLGLQPPTTWAQFQTDAAAIHKADPNNFITFIDPSDAKTAESLMWQAGGTPFATTGTDVHVDLQSAGVQKYANLWSSLVQQKLVDVAPAFTDAFYKSLASGKYAIWLVGAWAPTFLQSVVPQTAGLWRAAQLPQWNASASLTTQDASAIAVTAQSHNKAAAAEFAEFLNTNQASVQSLVTNSELIPAASSVTTSTAFANAPDAFLGGQQANQVFVGAGKGVVANAQWLPFETYADSVYADTAGQALANSTSYLAGLKAWQDRIVTYGKQQGFTMTTP